MNDERNDFANEMRSNGLDATPEEWDAWVKRFTYMSARDRVVCWVFAMNGARTVPIKGDQDSARLFETHKIIHQQLSQLVTEAYETCVPSDVFDNLGNLK